DEGDVHGHLARQQALEAEREAVYVSQVARRIGEGRPLAEQRLHSRGGSRGCENTAGEGIRDYAGRGASAIVGGYVRGDLAEAVTIARGDIVQEGEPPAAAQHGLGRELKSCAD